MYLYVWVIISFWTHFPSLRHTVVYPLTLALSALSFYISPLARAPLPLSPSPLIDATATENQLFVTIGLPAVSGSLIPLPPKQQ